MTAPKKKPTKRRTSTKSGTKKKVAEKVVVNVPAVLAGEHDTFTTLKKKTAMLEALTLSLGIIAPAALAVGISRQTHYAWMKSDSGYAEEVDNITDDMSMYDVSKYSSYSFVLDVLDFAVKSSQAFRYG